MDFSFSDEQVERRQSLRRTLAQHFPLSALRAWNEAAPDVASTLVRNRWATLDALGTPRLLVPKKADGIGLSDIDLVGLLEEAGWSALPDPLLETAGLAAPILAALLPAPAAAAGLRALVRNQAALAVGGIDIGPAGPTSPTTVSADGMLRTPRVVGARHAAFLLLACHDPDSGWQLHAVRSQDCTISTTATLDPGRDMAVVRWPLSSETLLAYGVAAEAAIGVMADRGAAGSAAFLNGLAERMLTLAADDATDRRQSGLSVGSFDAVRHLLAHARVKLEFARPATYRAAWSLASAQPTVSHDASMAKALASEAAKLAARAALQVHGPIGYTWDCDLHFFMKRTWALAKAWGDAATHRQLVLAQVRRRRF